MLDAVTVITNMYIKNNLMEKSYLPDRTSGEGHSLARWTRVRSLVRDNRASGLVQPCQHVYYNTTYLLILVIFRHVDHLQKRILFFMISGEN